MNALTLKGNWNQLKGAVKAKWAELTDDDMMAIEAESDKLVGKIQERYGCKREEAEEEIKDFLKDQQCC